MLLKSRKQGLTCRGQAHVRFVAEASTSALILQVHSPEATEGMAGDGELVEHLVHGMVFTHALLCLGL